MGGEDLPLPTPHAKQQRSKDGYLPPPIASVPQAANTVTPSATDDYQPGSARARVRAPVPVPVPAPVSPDPPEPVSSAPSKQSCTATIPFPPPKDCTLMKLVQFRAQSTRAVATVVVCRAGMSEARFF